VTLTRILGIVISLEKIKFKALRASSSLATCCIIRWGTIEATQRRIQSDLKLTAMKNTKSNIKTSSLLD
jgi:hypothetical protein